MRFLGDIVNSQPVYVKAPFAEYFDAGYEDFKVAQKDRASTVYVGANDGMLHAFNANAYAVWMAVGIRFWTSMAARSSGRLFQAQ
jgi:Tfp pilus tip-associated adhesin PilY1